jgi:hypothetical protein
MAASSGDLSANVIRRASPQAPGARQPPGRRSGTMRGTAGLGYKQQQKPSLKPRPRLPLPDKTSSRLLTARLEEYQQLGRVRQPQCRSAAMAGDRGLDALAVSQLASKRPRIRGEIADPLADDQDQPGRANDLAVPARARNRPEQGVSAAATGRLVSTASDHVATPTGAIASRAGRNHATSMTATIALVDPPARLGRSQRRHSNGQRSGHRASHRGLGGGAVEPPLHMQMLDLARLLARPGIGDEAGSRRAGGSAPLIAETRAHETACRITGLRRQSLPRAAQAPGQAAHRSPRRLRNW